MAMFAFLGFSHEIGLIQDFMHKWHKLDQDEERQVKAKRERELGFRRLQLRQDYENIAHRVEDRKERIAEQKEELEEDLDAGKRHTANLRAIQKKAEEMKIAPPTLRDISEGTGLSHEEILKALKSAEDQFVHVPSSQPELPHLTRFAMREHLDKLELTNWQPGVGF